MRSASRQWRQRGRQESPVFLWRGDEKTLRIARGHLFGFSQTGRDPGSRGSQRVGHAPLAMARPRAIPVRSRPLSEKFRRHRILFGIFTARPRRLRHGGAICESVGGSLPRVAFFPVADCHPPPPPVFFASFLPADNKSPPPPAPH